MAKISKTAWSYAAAMVDGEGHFSISRHKQLMKSGKFYWMFDAKVGVSNISVVLMNWLKSNFGGDYRDGKQGGKRPCYRWDLDGYVKMEHFVLAILPYLIIKREQASVFLEFLRMKNQKNPAKRMELCLRCQALNRGETPTTNTSDTSPEVKIESDLRGDTQSAPAVTQEQRFEAADQIGRDFEKYFSAPARSSSLNKS